MEKLKNIKKLLSNTPLVDIEYRFNNEINHVFMTLLKTKNLKKATKLWRFQAGTWALQSAQWPIFWN